MKIKTHGIGETVEKFRAWCPKQPDWYEGDKAERMHYDVSHRPSTAVVLSYDQRDGESYAEGVVVMQYIGLKDKNGKEIYEGDILPYKYVVSWCDGLGDSLGMNVGWYAQRGDWESWTELNGEDENEVLGNIFESPKLLDK